MVAMPHHHNLSQLILMVTHSQDMDNRADIMGSSRVDISNLVGINNRAEINSNLVISNPVEINSNLVISSPVDISRDRMERLRMALKVLGVLPLWACNPILKQV
jgi:hypothetical protein